MNTVKTIILALAISLPGLAAEDVKPAQKASEITKEAVLAKQVELLKLELEASKAQTQFISARVQADEVNKQLTALVSARKAEKKCELDQNLDCIKEKK